MRLPLLLAAMLAAAGAARASSRDLPTDVLKRLYELRKESAANPRPAPPSAPEQIREAAHRRLFDALEPDGPRDIVVFGGGVVETRAVPNAASCRRAGSFAMPAVYDCSLAARGDDRALYLRLRVPASVSVNGRGDTVSTRAVEGAVSCSETVGRFGERSYACVTLAPDA